MTEEKQNIAIYKLLGYKPRRMWRYWYNKDKNWGALCLESREEVLKIIKEEKTHWPFIDYPEEYEFSEPEEYDDWHDLPSVDLDFINRAEDALSIEQIRIYHQELQDMFPFSAHTPTPAISAKVEERRKALLKALNLWEE